MCNNALQLETLKPEVLNYIHELEINYNKQIIELEKFKSKYYELKEQYDLLVYKRFCRSAEELSDDKQQSLFVEEEEQTNVPEEKTEKQEIKSYTRKKPGRKPLDPNLRRVEEIIDIPEEEKVCACGEKLTRIGEEISEKLEIIPQFIYITRTIRPKYACRHCEGTEDESEQAVKIAPVPPSIIPRSIASASLLSYIMIQKYQDHLPFYRQEAQFKRIGIEISD